MNSFSSPSKIDREKIIEILGRIYTFSINPSLRREQWNEYFLDFIRTLHQECRSQGVDVEEKTHITYYSNILKQAIRPQYLYRYRNVNNFSFDELNKEYTWLAKPSTLNDKLEGKGVCYTIPPETMPAFIPREWRNKSIPIDTFGISCFSEAKNGNDDDPICHRMLSQYTDNKGIVLQYRAEDIRDISPIYYCKKSVTLKDLFDPLSGSLCTKNIDWSDEREWRIARLITVSEFYTPKEIKCFKEPSSWIEAIEEEISYREVCQLFYEDNKESPYPHPRKQTIPLPTKIFLAPEFEHNNILNKAILRCAEHKNIEYVQIDDNYQLNNTNR